MRDDELLDALGAALAPDEIGEPEAGRVAAIRAAAAAASTEWDEASGGPSRSDGLVPLRSRRGARVLAAAAALLFAVGVGTVLGIAIGDDDPVTEGIVEYAGPITGSGGARGDLSVILTGIGRVVELDTTALEILPTGEFYEVWFVAPGDTPENPRRISAGTFHPDEEGRSEVRFAAAVDPTLFPLVQITAEPGDGDPRATGEVVLEVRIDR